MGGWNLKDYDNGGRTTAIEKITSSNGLHHLLYQKIRRCCNLSQPNCQCLVSNVARQHKKHLLTFEYYWFVPSGFPNSWPLLWRRRSVILSQSNLCPVPEKKNTTTRRTCLTLETSAGCFKVRICSIKIRGLNVTLQCWRKRLSCEALKSLLVLLWCWECQSLSYMCIINIGVYLHNNYRYLSM